MENEKMQKEKKELDTKIDEITIYLFDELGDKIEEMLPTSQEGNNFYLHILIYGKNNITLEYIQPGHYNNIEKIDINLGRVCIWDDYDLDEAKENLGKDFDDIDKLEEDAYGFFRDNCYIEEYIKDAIEELPEEEINKLYNIIK